MSDSSLPKPVSPITPTPVAPAPVVAPSAPAAPPLPSTPAPIPVPVGSASPPPPPPGSLPPMPPAPPEPPKQPTPSAPADQPKKSDKKKVMASVKKSPFRFLPYVLGGLVLVGILVFVFTRLFGNKNSQTTNQAASDEARKTVPAQQITLTYWGLWEPSNVLDSVFKDFEAQNPGVKINYVKQSHQDYRERLQSAVASGNGPDIFRFHATWTPMLSEELAVMPQSVMSIATYQQVFYPAATQMLSSNGQIKGIPLMYDGLGLYYNQDLLKAANAQPPTTWSELKLLAASLTVKKDSKIERGGLAIGNASNVEHFADILALLMLQNGADLTDPTTQEAEDALTFYTNFVKRDEVWSDDLPSSTVAFARGDAAMMFAPSWRAHEVQSINPDLKFGIVTVPTLGDEKIAWASFWAEGVSSKSKNAQMSWELLKYLSSSEVQQQLYSNQSQVRSFGEIYSRVDLADQLASDDLVSPYLQDAPNAKSWYLSSATHDNGLNDLLIKYYRDAVNAILTNKQSVTEALETVSQGTAQVLRQYGVE